MPLLVLINMLSSEWRDGIEGGRMVRVAEDGGIRVGYINMGGSVDATHEFSKRCAREGIVVAFVGECWVEKKSGLGTQSHSDYVRLGSVSGGARVACYL